MKRICEKSRVTSETNIQVKINLDGSGLYNIKTGVGFFDHMLEGFAKHGFFDLDVKVQGDLHVDCHHSIEDTGIVLGEAIKEALGDKKGIRRFGDTILPMDEALLLTALDLSGRPYFVFDAEFTTPGVGDLDTEMVHEFFYALTYSIGMTLHMKQMAGKNHHHIIEGLFKSFAKSLDQAVSFDGRIQDVLSTKGVL